MNRKEPEVKPPKEMKDEDRIKREMCYFISNVKINFQPISCPKSKQTIFQTVPLHSYFSHRTNYCDGNDDIFSPKCHIHITFSIFVALLCAFINNIILCSLRLETKLEHREKAE